MVSEIRITTKTIITVVLAALGFWLIIQLRAILLILFVAVLLALALDPFVDWLTKRKVPRGIAVFLVFFILGFVFAGFGVLGISPLVEQTNRFLQQLPNLLIASAGTYRTPTFLQQFGQALAQQLTTLSGNVLKVTWGAFSSALTILSVLVLSSYVLLDLENLKKLLFSFLKQADHGMATGIIDEMESKLGAWLRGQLLLMLCIGLMTFSGLWVLGINYALPLAVIAGLLEIVPTIGPIVAAVPAALVGFAISPLAGVGVVILFILIQQLENSFVVPRVMQRAVGFNPLITLIILLAGGQLFGIVGAVLAVPTVLVGSILFQHLVEK